MILELNWKTNQDWMSHRRLQRCFTPFTSLFPNLSPNRSESEANRTDPEPDRTESVLDHTVPYCIARSSTDTKRSSTSTLGIDIAPIVFFQFKIRLRSFNIVYAISIPNDLKKSKQACYFEDVSQLLAYFKEKFLVLTMSMAIYLRRAHFALSEYNFIINFGLAVIEIFGLKYRIFVIIYILFIILGL